MECGGGDFGPDHNKVREKAMVGHDRGFRKSVYSAKDRLSVEDEAVVENKVGERVEAKRRRDFVRADAIRDELVERFGVVMSDKLKQWSVGGGVLGRMLQRSVGCTKGVGVVTLRSSS